jgi:plasmid stabilization system protein ParE
MAYRVRITARAEQDLDRIYNTVTGEAPYRGIRWFDRFEQSILSLSSFPGRCAIVPRLSTDKRIVRQLFSAGAVTLTASTSLSSTM